MYKLTYHVPESHLETTKQAVFAAGGGRVGEYDQCCWQVLGEGQFRPQAGSQPYLGEHDAIEHVPEYRVELVCEDYCVAQVVAALKAAHPYEAPSYAAWQLADV